MPVQSRKLTSDEVYVKFPRRGHMDLSEYEELFEGLKPLEGFAVDCDGVSVRAMKRRLGQAVKHALGENAKLRYGAIDKQNPSMLTFILREPSTKASTVSNGRRKRS